MRKVSIASLVGMVAILVVRAAVAQSISSESLLSETVIIKNEVREAILNGKGTEWRYLDLIGKVMEIKGDRLRVELSWLKREDIMTKAEAAKFFEDELRHDPNSAKAKRGRAIVMLHSNSAPKDGLESAITDLTDVLRQNPKDADALRWRGNIFSSLRKHEHAKQDFDASLKLNPDSPSTLLSRAWIFFASGDLPGAIRDCDDAISLDPFHARNHSTKAAIQTEAKLYSDALQGFSEEIRLEPRDPNAYFCRGWTLMVLNNFRDAQLDFTKQIELAPSEREPFRHRGMCRTFLNDSKGAIEDFSKMIELGADKADGYQLRGAAKATQEDYEGAIADSEAALERDVKSISAHNVIANCCYLTKKYEQALPHLDELINDGTIQKPETLLFRAFIYQVQGEFVMAARDIDEAIKLAPTNASCYRAKVTLLATCSNSYFRDPEMATKLIAEAEKLEPDSALTHAAKACLLALKGDYKSAILLQKKALEDKKYAEDPRPIIGAEDARARIAAWEKGELWTTKKR